MSIPTAIIISKSRNIRNKSNLVISPLRLINKGRGYKSNLRLNRKNSMFVHQSKQEYIVLQRVHITDPVGCTEYASGS